MDSNQAKGSRHHMCTYRAVVPLYGKNKGGSPWRNYILRHKPIPAADDDCFVLCSECLFILLGRSRTTLGADAKLTLRLVSLICKYRFLIWCRSKFEMI